MKKILTGFLCLAILILCILAINKSTRYNASPEKLYNKDNTIDFMIYNNTVYVNASDIDWIKELKLNHNKLLGTITRSKITKNFKEFDATSLKIGTEVYSTNERQDIVLVFTEGSFIPYYKYVEG